MYGPGLVRQGFQLQMYLFINYICNYSYVDCVCCKSSVHRYFRAILFS